VSAADVTAAGSGLMYPAPARPDDHCKRRRASGSPAGTGMANHPLPV